MYMRKCTSLRCSANAHKKSCSCGKKGNQAERQATLLRGNYREKRRLGSFVRPLRVCNCVPFCCFFLSIFFHITMYRNDNVYPIRMRQVRTLPCCIMVCVLKKMAGRKRHSKCFLFFFFRLLAPLTFHCCYKYNQLCWKLTECFRFGWLRIMWSNGHLWNDPACLEFGASKSAIDVIRMHKYMNDAKKKKKMVGCFIKPVSRCLRV